MLGRVDLLVNCLKFQPDSEFEETVEDVFEKTINTNLKSAAFVTQAALPLMKTRPKPKIINVRIGDWYARNGIERRVHRFAKRFNRLDKIAGKIFAEKISR